MYFTKGIEGNALLQQKKQPSILTKLLKEKMKTAENIQKTALVFFILLGSTHILSGLSVNNNYLLPSSLIVNKILDIPFAMTALLYGLSSIYTKLKEEYRKPANIIFMILSASVFVILLYINFLLPDKILTT